MTISILGALFASLLGLSYAIPGNEAKRKEAFYPAGLAIGNSPSPETARYQSFTLTPSAAVATLDYGYEVAGYPLFEISNSHGDVQIEVKYSEEYAGLLSPLSDGPWVYSVGLSNTYRVETFNVTETGVLEPFFLQGGQRWQSITLLTQGSVKFTNVGFKASVDALDLNQLPGYFDSDNFLYNSIWDLGARAVQASCLTAGSQRAIWEADTKDGSLVRGMRPALTTKAQNFSDYTLTFTSKIVRGGVGWTLAQPFSSFNGGIQLNLIGELPDSTSFANTNRTLTPPNTLVLGYGWSPFVNQTTLTSYRLADVRIPFPIREGTWYSISTTIGDDSVKVNINGHDVLNTPIKDYWLPANVLAAVKLNSGTFGFGGYQDQSAYIKDVKVSGSNGELLYSNSMTDPSTFEEYGVHENFASVCLDGPKRDRLVWLGDFFHTTRIVGVSTARWDFITETLKNSLSWQSLTTGLLPIAQPMGYPSSSKADAPLASQSNFGLMDYQLLGFIAFYNYVEETNDLEFVRETWSQWQLQLDFMISTINKTTGLVSLTTGSAFTGPGDGGSAVSSAMVQTLNHASQLAASINDTSSAIRYQDISRQLKDNINSKLWNEDLGVYSVSLADRGNFSVASISFCITSGVASPERAQKSILNLEKLKLGPGFKDSSSANSSDPSTNLSPNTNGFLLTALMESNAISIASSLISSLWGAMVTNSTTSTGASWEYVNQQGQPGLGLFTSLSHPWGGAATYILTKYVAGIRPTEWGFKKWVIEPNLEFGVKNVKSGIETPYGKLSVDRKISGKYLIAKITSPKGTKGELVLKGVDSSSGRSGRQRRVVPIDGGGVKEFSIPFKS